MIEWKRITEDIDEVHQYGGDGRDTIRFAYRQDREDVKVFVTGGEGEDHFQPVNRQADAALQDVVITDFEVGVDKFHMSYSQFWEKGPIEAGDGTIAANENGDTVITIADIGQFTLEGVEFNEDDFSIFGGSGSGEGTISGLDVTYEEAFTFEDDAPVA